MTIYSLEDADRYEELGGGGIRGGGGGVEGGGL